MRSISRKSGQPLNTLGLPLLKAAPKSLPRAMRAPMVGRLAKKYSVFRRMRISESTPA